jgi:hypothetical protein
MYSIDIIMSEDKMVQFMGDICGMSLCFWLFKNDIFKFYKLMDFYLRVKLLFGLRGQCLKISHLNLFLTDNIFNVWSFYDNGYESVSCTADF